MIGNDSSLELIKSSMIPLRHKSRTPRFLFFILPLVPAFLHLTPLCRASDSPPEPDTQQPFLGWIPIQFLEPGTELILDMRRFMNPGPNGKLSFENPHPHSIEYDPQKLTLKFRPKPKFTGLIDIPLRLSDFGGKKISEAILTIAITASQNAAKAPIVFADSHANAQLTFRVVSTDDSPITKTSCVLQLPDGSSSTLQVQPVAKETISVPTSNLPTNSWIRLAVANSAGNISRPARFQIAKTESSNWQDGIIYYAFTDRFSNGDPSNDRPVEHPEVSPQANYQGGDFQGILQKIQQGYFSKIGINILWLAPLNQNPNGAWQEYLPPYRFYTGYHGYWPVTHTTVEPRFGGAPALRNLIQAARENNIRIIADLVLRHVHVEHPLWNEKRDWFGNLILPDGRKNLRLWDEQQFTTWFEEWLPGFDFENPKATSFLINNASWWLESFKLDGFRLDAVKHIYPAFWWKFRSAMRNTEKASSRGPHYYVGETFMDRRGIMQFVGPNMLDGQFDFPLYDTLIEVFAKSKKSFDELETSLLESEIIYGKETLMSPLIGNHDKPRFLAYADGDLPDPLIDDEEEVGWKKPPQVDNPDSYKKLTLALAFILAIDGVPMIYYGDEVGLTGAGDPDNRRFMPHDADLTPPQIEVRKAFEKLANARHKHPALRYGSRRLLLANQNQYAFVRRHLNDTVIAAWNTSSQPASFHLNVSPEFQDGACTDSLNPSRKITIKNGSAKFELPPLTVAFFTPSDN